jgi:hypothetical protein
MLYNIGKIFKGYKVLSSHFQIRLDLNNIWTFTVLAQQKSQFWDSQRKVTFGCNPHGTKYIIGRGVMPSPKGCEPCKAYAWGCPY